MIDRTVKLNAVILISLIILSYISISLAVIMLLVGFIIIPPVAVVAYVFAQGTPLLRREIEVLLRSGKDFLLISVSKEYITLEPQFRKGLD